MITAGILDATSPISSFGTPMRSRVRLSSMLSEKRSYANASSGSRIESICAEGGDRLRVGSGAYEGPYN
jgi:hypothetical protein